MEAGTKAGEGAVVDGGSRGGEEETFYRYVSDRMFTLATLGGLLGTQSYISGKMSFPLALYYYSFCATISSASFFAIAYGIRKVSMLTMGDSDDTINHAISGGLLLAQYSSLRFGRRAIPSRFLLGAAFGAGYHYATSQIYEASRANWIEYRINPSGRPEVWRNPSPKHGDFMYGTRDLDPLRSAFKDLYDPLNTSDPSKKPNK